MPIRPENKARYPANWREISDRIRWDRAGARCECRGECGRAHDGRCQAVHGREHPVTGAVVVLTVGHLDHRPENCDEPNLKAWCQACHNAYDMPHRASERSERQRNQNAVRDLFP